MSDASRVADKAAATTPTKGRRRSLLVRTTRVHPLVPDEAKRLAVGDLDRLKIVNGDCVVVLNRPAQTARP